ncbi:MAG: IS1634 family transposase [Patescibacteria group bacterium]
MVLIKRRKIKGHVYLYVVRNYREKDKVKQKYIAYLGREDNLPNLLSEYAKLRNLTNSELENLSYSAPLELLKLANEIEIPKVFASHFKKEWGVDAGVASTLMILNYCFESKSKNKLSDWYEQTYLKHELKIPAKKINRDLLYHTLDLFSEEKIEKIHEEIFKKAKEKFNLSEDITTYDVTALLFEGDNCSLAKRGYNAEAMYKFQANLGLAITNEKFPVAHKTFEGNIKDVTTFDKMIALLNKTINLKNTIFIFDRGIFSEANKQKILSFGSKYISGFKKYPEIKGLIKSTKETDFKIADKKTLFYEIIGEERKIIFWNKEMAEEQKVEREKRLKKIEEELKKIDYKRYDEKRLYEKVGQITGKKRKCFEIDYKTFSIKRNEVTIKEMERLDGKSVLVTNTDLEAKDILKKYRDKNIVEMSFKDLKMFVDVRPIRHWKEKRVLAHIFLAVLAFGLRSLLELKLRRAGLEITAQESIEQLSRIRVLCAKGKILRTTGETETTKEIQQVLSKKG